MSDLLRLAEAGEETTIELLDEAIETLRSKGGSEVELARALGNRAAIAFEKKDVEKAEELFRETIEIINEKEHPLIAAKAFYSLALLLFSTERYDEALVNINKGLGIKSQKVLLHPIRESLTSLHALLSEDDFKGDLKGLYTRLNKVLQ